MVLSLFYILIPLALLELGILMRVAYSSYYALQCVRFVESMVGLHCYGGLIVRSLSTVIISASFTWCDFFVFGNSHFESVS